MPEVRVNVRQPPTTIEGLDDLLAGFRGLGDDYVVTLNDETPTGYAVTFFQIYWLVVDNIESHVIDALAAAFVAWAIKTVRRDRDEKGHVNPRPRKVSIYAPNGDLLRSVVVKDPDAGSEDTTAADIEQASELAEIRDRVAREHEERARKTSSD